MNKFSKLSQTVTNEIGVLERRLQKGKKMLRLTPVAEQMMENQIHTFHFIQGLIDDIIGVIDDNGEPVAQSGSDEGNVSD